MARLSLWWFVMPAVTVGCLGPTPEYSVPEQIPPVIIASQVVPPLSEVTTWTKGGPGISFNVPFRSDDAGEDLRAVFVLDLPVGISPGAVRGDKIVPASPLPFDRQQNRSVSWVWSDTTDPAGCHTITLILSHRSNFLDSYNTEDDLASAQVTWFLDVRDPSDPSTSPGCWQPGTTGGGG